MTSRADQHDLDKLARWHRDLTGNPGSAFPVYAIFLVSADDREAHDIFRKFRASFESHRAGFENLVIFGQHGISTTAQSLLAEFGLAQGAIPTLALLASYDTTVVYTLPLPSGDKNMPDADQLGQTWEEALGRVETAMKERERNLELASIDGLTRHQLADGPLVTLVSKLLNCLS
jgi:hypothetical protein